MSIYVILCGDSDRLDPLPDCKNRLHSYPMPAGYVQSHTEAGRRLSAGWTNKKCQECNTYGWEQP